MCGYVDSDLILPGWGCCSCRVYNGMRNAHCRGCGAARCATLQPDDETGRAFEDRLHRHEDFAHLFTPCTPTNSAN